MSAMNDTVPKDSIFGQESASEQTWQGDAQTTSARKQLRKSGSLGIGKVLEAPAARVSAGRCAARSARRREPEDRPVTDSWERFAGALGEEASLLTRDARVRRIATDASARSTATPRRSWSAERELDAARRAYQAACGKRRGMQVRGFGTMTLRQVCAYAPRESAPAIGQRLHGTHDGFDSTRHYDQQQQGAHRQRHGAPDEDDVGVAKSALTTARAPINGAVSFRRRPTASW